MALKTRSIEPPKPPIIEQKMRMNLLVEIHPAEEGGYWATVKNLPGCVSEGDTLAEVRRNIREAIECHLDLPSKPPTKRKPRTAAK